MNWEPWTGCYKISDGCTNWNFIGGEIMKIEIGKDFPQYFKPSYPEEFELFSHFETTAGIPTVFTPGAAFMEIRQPSLLLWETYTNIHIPMPISRGRTVFVSIFFR